MPDSAEPLHVLVTLPLSEELRDEIRRVSERVELVVQPARSPRDIPDEVWAQTQVLYTHSALPEPDQAPQLRWIQTHTAGVDHLLDRPIVQAEGVLLTSASGIHVTTIAEYVFMMMLALGHKLPRLMALQAEAIWPETPWPDPDERLVPRELRGGTLGIMGYGSLGRELARLGRAFGMEVLAVKRDVRRPSDPDSYTLPGTGDPEGVYFHRLYPPEALISMARDCDFLAITVPLTESTRGAVNAEVLAAMKPTAYLINVSRGGVVDEAALLAALRAGQIAGAALDVFESEPLPADSPLWKQPNLIVTPHVAGMSRDYEARAVRLFVENLRRYLAHKDLLNQVDRARGY